MQVERAGAAAADPRPDQGVTALGGVPQLAGQHADARKAQRAAGKAEEAVEPVLLQRMMDKNSEQVAGLIQDWLASKHLWS